MLHPAGSVAVVAATVIASGVLLHASEPGPTPGQLGFAYPETVQLHHPAVTTTVHVVPELVDRRWLGFDAPIGVIGHDDDDHLLLATGDGTAVRLRHLREVVSAYPVGDGWSVVASGDRDTLWWVGEQGRPVLVLGSLDALAVDRSRVAWRRGPVLSTARLSGNGRLEQQVDTLVPDGGVDPAGFLGEAVLLSHTQPDGTPAGFEIWRPEAGSYQPSPAPDVAWVFGARAGGGTAVGLVTGAGQPCLALLDTGDRLTLEATACLPVLPGAGPAALSPDGRWLLGTSPGAGGAGAGVAGEAILVDLHAAFSGDPAAGIRLDGVAGPLGQPVWLNADSAVFVSQDGAVQVWPDRVVSGAPRPSEPVDVPGRPVVVFPLT
jgi:hypothetical protein